MAKVYKKSIRQLITNAETSSRSGIKLTKNRFKLFTLIFVTLALSFSFTLFYFWDEPLLSPLSSLTTFRFLRDIKGSSTQKKLVYAFLPYWNLDDVEIQPEITHLAYFSLTLGADGNIVLRQDEGAEPGYHKLGSDQLMELANQVNQNDSRVEIVLTQFNNDDIVALATNETAHQNLITSLDSILLAYPVSGVNIDIEYTGEVTANLRTKFAQLIRALNQHLDNKYDHVQLSIDMYASAASKEQIWDVRAIAPEVDYIVVMAYDFHRRSSPQAGPVAPLFGGKDLWDTDINQHLKAFVEKVPKQKLLLGVPFYGYQWQTTSLNPQSATYPETGSTASYKKVQELLARQDELNLVQSWDDQALSPYLGYRENDEYYMIYYEDRRSIAYKLEYVNQLDLAGIAIWALGYDGNHRELWDVVSNKLP